MALKNGTQERDTVAVKQRTVVVNDRMQQGYRYVLVAPVGRNFDPDFRPELTPPEMLRLGVFGGKYLTDCRDEFPASWFARAKLSPERSDAKVNFFGVAASQPLSVWRKKGWIHREDPRGWFQWYCRYYRGRRLPDEDARQIKRWAAIRRHVRQLQMNCEPGMFSAGSVNGRRCCIGPMTAGNFDVKNSTFRADVLSFCKIDVD